MILTILRKQIGLNEVVFIQSARAIAAAHVGWWLRFTILKKIVVSMIFTYPLVVDIALSSHVIIHCCNQIIWRDFLILLAIVLLKLSPLLLCVLFEIQVEQWLIIELQIRSWSRARNWWGSHMNLSCRFAFVLFISNELLYDCVNVFHRLNELVVVFVLSI